jgi:Co/Zn/Cd efflux system component
MGKLGRGPVLRKSSSTGYDKAGIAPIMGGMDNPPKHLSPAYQNALLISAVLNLAMLFLEGGVGWWIGSSALLADAVDFLEDGAAFGFALFAIGWTPRARASAGLLQGLAMAGVGTAAVIQIIHRILERGAPSAASMGGVAVLALAVNVYCAYRLIHYRAGDASMRALWLSTRNDAMLNLLTIAAAGLIAVTRSGWPDIVGGAVIASVNLWASIEVIRAAASELRALDSN